MDKLVSFYADYASAFPFNAPMANGKEQIRTALVTVDVQARLGLSLMPTRIEVSKSSDPAHETGKFELKLNDAQGNPISIPGKYAFAW